MIEARDILRLMPRGKWMSAMDLAAGVKLEMSVLDRRIRSLVDDGVAIGRCRQRGYRLEQAIDFIDQDCLAAQLARDSELDPRRVEVLDQVDSTSTRLLNWSNSDDIHGRVCVSEFQSAGRGRHGRRWHGARYRNVMLSLAWLWTGQPAKVAGLSLSIGVAVGRVLSQLTSASIQLKWPNDILADEGKLAGILVDVMPPANGPMRVVIGLGVNVNNPPELDHKVDQRVSNLCDSAIGPVSRTRLAGNLVLALAGVLDRFALSGFTADYVQWNALDAFRDKPVMAVINGVTVNGKGRGVNQDGSYAIIDQHGHLYSATAGEVQLMRYPQTNSTGCA